MLNFESKKNNFITFFLFILIIGLSFGLKDNEILYKTYRVNIKEVSGISVNDNIVLSGKKIGYVKSINFDPSNYHPYLLINIEKNIHLTEDVVFKVVMGSLFAPKSILKLVNGIEETFLENGDIIYDSRLGLNLDKIFDLLNLYMQQKKQNIKGTNND